MAEAGTPARAILLLAGAVLVARATYVAGRPYLARAAALQLRARIVVTLGDSGVPLDANAR